MTWPVCWAVDTWEL